MLVYIKGVDVLVIKALLKQLFIWVLQWANVVAILILIVLY